MIFITASQISGNLEQLKEQDFLASKPQTLYVYVYDLFIPKYFFLICVLQDIVGLRDILHPKLLPPYNFNDPPPPSLGVEGE